MGKSLKVGRSSVVGTSFGVSAVGGSAVVSGLSVAVSKCAVRSFCYIVAIICPDVAPCRTIGLALTLTGTPLWRTRDSRCHVLSCAWGKYSIEMDIIVRRGMARLGDVLPGFGSGVGVSGRVKPRLVCRARLPPRVLTLQPRGHDLADHHTGQVRVGSRHLRHDRGVDHAQTVQAE